jgi:hypothetical protein
VPEQGLFLGFALAAVGLILAVSALLAWQLRRRGLDTCLVPYLLRVRKRRPRRRGEPAHLLLCIADHYEPAWGLAPADVAQDRVERWVREYPARFGHLRDSDGQPPRHTFFYPLESYEPAHLAALADLCQAGFGEVEVHLHHDHDTAENLRAKLQEYKDLLARRHRLLAQHRQTGELGYGFIHGNWALDNSRPDGRWCGVNNELNILRETGCYADFTLPSAPSPTQTRKINALYYASDDPERPKSHNTGVDVGKGPAPDNALLLLQGPLLLDWGRRKWGLLPRLENACLQRGQPPTGDRLRLWLKARIQVPSRPDWFFVKLHTHGAKEANADLLLGEPMLRFHQLLAEWAEDDPQFHFHYVTAREMVNLVRAAEAGWTGSVSLARDYEWFWNGHVPRSLAGVSRSVNRPTVQRL